MTTNRTKTTAKSEAVNTDTGEIVYQEFPPGVYLESEGGEIVGIFVRAELCPEDYPSAQEFGRSIIVTFEAVRGTDVSSNSGPVDLVPGELYSLWLTSQTLHDGFVDAAPEPGEKFGVKHFGERVSRTRKDPKTGDPVAYTAFRVAFPDRPVEVRETFSWGAAELKGKKR